jgi:tetraacyldisaccharide 4'-kinase
MQIIVLDDGFQHRRLHRNLDIVLIDATCPFGFGYLLPRGLLREHLTGLQRADVIAISRSGRVTQDERETITARIRDLNPNALLALCDHFPKRLIGHESNMPLESLQGRSVASFAGIGNPQPFFESLRELGANVVATRSLNDHCRFDQATVAGLAKWLSQLKNEHPGLMAVCTHKDLVKLRSTEIGQVPLWGLEIELGFSRGAAEFWNAIDMHLEKP